MDGSPYSRFLLFCASITEAEDIKKRLKS